MVNTARPRTRTLWILAAAFAAIGVLLLYHPWNADRPATVESPQLSNPEPDGHIGRITAVAPTRSETGPGTPSPEPVQPEPANEPEPWLAAATGYADAFTARAKDHAEWVAGLKPWVTRHLAEQYERTNPARRPRGAVDRVETIASGDYSAHVRVAYDTGLELMVRVANGPDGWRVTYVEPVAGS